VALPRDLITVEKGVAHQLPFALDEDGDNATLLHVFHPLIDVLGIGNVHAQE
jgi:hypothetical protein